MTVSYEINWVRFAKSPFLRLGFLTQRDVKGTEDTKEIVFGGDAEHGDRDGRAPPQIHVL